MINMTLSVAVSRTRGIHTLSHAHFARDVVCYRQISGMKN